MEKVRINKYLANLGIDSRRAIDKMIENKRITVNGKLIQAGIKVNNQDKIFLDGKLLKKEKKEKIYFMVNKPQKVLSAVKDERGRKLVVDLVNTAERLFPIGRLDYDTEGLIILTNDGEIYNKIIHPRTEVFKTYYVEVLGSINMSNLNKIKKGLIIEEQLTLPAKAKIISSSNTRTTLNLSIKEGRNRQIRKMFDSIGNKVVFLKRISIGELILDPSLKPGESRILKKKEIRYLNSI